MKVGNETIIICLMLSLISFNTKLKKVATNYSFFYHKAPF